MFIFLSFLYILNKKVIVVVSKNNIIHYGSDGSHVALNKVFLAKYICLIRRIGTQVKLVS